MGQLRMKSTACKYKEGYRRLKEQFISGINDQFIIAEIIRKLTAIKYKSETTSTQVLSWAKRIEAQWPQKAMLDRWKESKDSDMINRTKCKTETEQHISR